MTPVTTACPEAGKSKCAKQQQQLMVLGAIWLAELLKCFEAIGFYYSTFIHLRVHLLADQRLEISIGLRERKSCFR